jgi:hypothetical protein
MLSCPRRGRWLPLLALTTLGLPGQAPATGHAPAELRQFANRNRTFHVDLPAGWRQIAPNEALRVAELGGAPRDLCRADPRAQYAVGPVERWLAGDFSSPWLHVTEIDEEAVIPEDFAGELQRMWREHGERTGTHVELSAIAREPLGSGQHPALTAVRRTSRDNGGSVTRSLDAYVATGRQQLTLAFTCADQDFDRWLPEFRRWLATATFARPSRATQKLSDRLWTPLLTGAVVAVLLVVLYKHTQGKR